ncbi:MAG TPA: ATP-binding cassette domain-containing protein [Sphingobacteriaceae bacterium]|nr:ATP-binding cassette domain-containing protein [Sphingobacteriaceae bacterium]
MLETDSLALAFWGKQVLSGCYINCKPGEVVGLLGRNGSGKSCLLRIIFGSLKADFKHQRIDGEVIGTGFKTDNIAYLAQDNFLPPFLKVSDILKTVIDNRDLILGNEVINKIINLRVRDLSGGELRFIECIWILNHQAAYILLDEPYSGLSPIQIEFLQELIKQVGKVKGIILTDHIYRSLIQISDRIVLLHNNAVYNINDEADLIRYNYIPNYA